MVANGVCLDLSSLDHNTGCCEGRCAARLGVKPGRHLPPFYGRGNHSVIRTQYWGDAIEFDMASYRRLDGVQYPQISNEEPKEERRFPY